MEKNYDVIVIGGGPAGVSAAVYCARGGFSVCMIQSGESALDKAESIQNYYGTGEISGAALYASGLEQARAVGVTVVDGQATFAAYDGSFSVDAVCRDGAGVKFASRKLVIATGARRAKANIDGLTEYEGRGVSYCAVCDAFFYRKKRVAVLGAGEYAEHEYSALSLASERFLLTDGKTPSFDADNVITKKIKRVFGSTDTGRLAGVEFEDGETLPIDGLFVALGTLGSTGLAKSMGILSDAKGAIVTDANGMTNIPGLYAAGDCTAGIKQVAKAVADGMVVGLAIVSALKAEARGANND